MKKTRLAILGAGNIAGHMARTIAHMPDIEAYAVAARDLDRAQAFAAEHGFTKAYGSYEELVRDDGVELIYVATPHSHHYEHAMLCLEYGRPVLCEKAFTANAAQAARLLDYAQKQGVFIAEAIWTRYMPLSKTIREVVDSGAIGTPTMLTANLGYLIEHKERIKRPELAGGALLDLAVYPINFASMVFGDKVEGVTATAILGDTGVDMVNSITLSFEGGRMAVLHSTARARTDRMGIVSGDKGYLVVENINNPVRFKVYSLDDTELACYEAPPKITGYEYEVTAAAKAIAEGRLECDEMPHRETLRVMRLMDDLRTQWGVRYPFDED